MSQVRRRFALLFVALAAAALAVTACSKNRGAPFDPESGQALRP